MNSVVVYYPLSTLLTIVFVILKLTGNIYWSWLWVFSPLWISFGLFLLAGLFFSVVLLFTAKSRAEKQRHDQLVNRLRNTYH